MYVDCRSEVGHERGTTFRRILSEELESVPGSVHVTACADDLEVYAENTTPSEPPPWVPSGTRILGFPDGFDEVQMRVVLMDAEFDEFRLYSGWLKGPCYAVERFYATDQTPELALEELMRVTELVIGARPRRRGLEDQDRLWADVRVPPAAVEVAAMRRAGVQGMPAWVKGIPEPTLAYVRVLWPRSLDEQRRDTPEWAARRAQPQLGQTSTSWFSKLSGSLPTRRARRDTGRR
jgi:hypothetical protein